ncbi:zona pellucida sperm-binding protein 3-like isoform X1 [Anguilla rostrata]|uniref:zona pellucida sperm-binding protein 3-like isoform X1 n=2 Tax=Anguilla rostrata TaxID=7938 RepID=UPI0030CD90FA
MFSRLLQEHFHVVAKLGRISGSGFINSKMTPVQIGVVLLVVASYALVHAEVSVECSWNDTVIVKWTERQRKTGSPDPYILLGNCLPTTTADGTGGEMETVFSTQLDDCRFRRMITEDQVIYSNELSYWAGATQTSYPVTCVYPRPQDWGPPLYTPTWLLLESGDLRFHMALMNGDFSGPAQSSTFYLGSLIPIWAAVDQQAHLPLLLLLDECVAATTPGPDPPGPVYPIIANGGCLMDSKIGRSMFRPRVKTSELELHVQAFKFSLGANIYIHCRLSVWDPESLDEGKKACFYCKDEKRWVLLDDRSQNSLCSCCDSHCGYRKTRGLRSGFHGLTHNAILGPLVVQDARETSLNASAKSLRTAGF